MYAQTEVKGQQTKPDRDQSPVSQTMSVLFNRLNEAKAHFEDLAAQLTPIRRESPTNIGKADGQVTPEPGPSCPMDAELMGFARRAQDLLDRICEVKGEIRI
jgi:hypothetical protein